MSSTLRASSTFLIILSLASLSLCVAFWWVDTFTTERAAERAIKEAGTIEFFDRTGKRLGSLEGQPLRELMGSFKVLEANQSGEWSGQEAIELHLVGADQTGDRILVKPLGTLTAHKGFWPKVRKALRE